MTQNVTRVTAFLLRNGIDSSEVELQGLRATDTLANPYNPPNRVGNRFVIQQTVTVRSDDPEKIRAASQKVGELVNGGSCSPRARSGGRAGHPTSSAG